MEEALDYTEMEDQKGDEEIIGFSYLDMKKLIPSKTIAW